MDVGMDVLYVLYVEYLLPVCIIAFLLLKQQQQEEGLNVSDFILY